MQQSKRYRLTINIMSEVLTGSVSLPFDAGNRLYEYRFDSQAKIDAHYKSAGGAPTPQIYFDSVAGPILRWPINDQDAFGRFKSDEISIPTTGIVDTEFLIRIPQSWLDLGKLPTQPATPGGDYMTWYGQKVFRMFPDDGGHNATLFAHMRRRQVYIRDFGGNDNTPPQGYLAILPDTWVGYRIRYDYPRETVGLWVSLNGGPFVEHWTQPGGKNAAGVVDVTRFVGPIFHATARGMTPPYGKHPLTYIDFHSYRVVTR